MILDLLVVIIFLYIGMIGFRRGAWLGALHLGSTIFSVWVAQKFYHQIAQRLELFIPFPKTRAFDLNYAIHFDNIHQRFDHIIAFLIIATLTKIICYGIIVVFDNILKFKRPNFLSRMIGTVMSLVSSIIISATLLYAIALYPLEIVQNQFINGEISEFLILHMPYISTYILNI
ncbi:CvpA family protein [Staphylococcus edaphicus]|uniref:Colicin V production protein CvpA n=1 Tax=Staphylococcus edaphicus TaxID=1955013 RepID=A0A2C6VK97_9STAP|nr:CvpA family protein [Staphylococcus edaphicus]PHK50621.1 colicin V production protein CvpA [Staphylococcus edaphicus]